MRNKIKNILQLLIFIFLFKNGFSQHPAFYQINDEDNLPSNEIYRVVQDNFGYIWIGCDAGLYRYDGFNYKLYNNSKQNGRGISFLQFDAKNRLWCKNFYGQICRVDGDSLRIIKSIKTSNASYPQFTIDDQCNLWIYKESGLVKCNETGDSLCNYKIQLKPNEEIASLYYDNGFIYAFSSSIEISKFAIKTHKIVKLPWTNKPPFVSKNCMFTKHKGKLFFLMKTSAFKDFNSIYTIDNDSVNEYYRFNDFDNNHLVYSIYSDGENLWATTSFGVFKINPKNLADKQSPLFSDQKISYMCKDREGMYWFSSLNNGLFVIPSIQVVQLNSSNSLLKENNILSLKVLSANKILLGSYLGNIYNYNQLSQFVKEDYYDKLEHFASVKQISVYKNFTLISRGRFCVIDNNTGKQYFPKISNIRDFEVVNDTIYMVLPEFICKIALFDLIKKDYNCLKINSLGGKAVEYNSQNKTFYFALGNGSFSYDLNGKWEELKVNQQSVMANSISYSDGLIWISTVASGVYGFENNKMKFHYNTNNYLNENNTRLVKAYDKTIWLTTDNYLYNINYISNKILKYDVTQSIRSKDINGIECYHDTIYLATKKGLLFFPGKMNSLNLVIPNIKITDVFLNNQLIDFSNDLSLSYWHTNLKISFSSVSLKSKGKFKYQYRLSGLDTSWVTISPTTPFVLFSRVPPGNFIFELRSLNENNVLSKTISFPVSVDFPFWNRWWFFVLMIILISGFVAFLFLLRIKIIKKRADLKYKVAASQLTALKSQMNPHFLFNTLNSLQDLILKHDIKNSNFYLNKFSLLMREILDVSGKDEITLAREIKMIDTYLELEKLRFGDDFKFDIIIDNELDVDYLKLPPMIIQPFIENSVKHGLLHKKGTKSLIVEFTLKSDVLICTVVDNGVGRKKSEEIKSRNVRSHQSFATQATEERMDLLNSFNDKKYNFEIIDLYEDDKSIGTKVVISIPV